MILARRSLHVAIILQLRALRHVAGSSKLLSRLLEGVEVLDFSVVVVALILVVGRGAEEEGCLGIVPCQP